jgi:hypothetical protein
VTIDKYTLLGKIPVPCLKLLAWGRWMEKNQRNRHVADNRLKGEVDGEPVAIRVSTVFLGVDHNWLDGGDPQIFETMVFGGPHDGDQWRYATWDEAEAGHARTLERERLWLNGLEQIQT